MSKRLFNKTQSILRGYGETVSVRSLILEVQKPVKHFPEGVDGILFLPFNANLIAYCKNKKSLRQWLDWEYRDKVVDAFGFADHVRAFGLKPAGSRILNEYREPTIIETLGPEFVADLKSMQGHRVLAEKWGLKTTAITYQRKKLGVAIQKERQEKGLTTYLK